MFAGPVRGAAQPADVRGLRRERRAPQRDRHALRRALGHLRRLAAGIARAVTLAAALVTGVAADHRVHREQAAIAGPAARAARTDEHLLALGGRADVQQRAALLGRVEQLGAVAAGAQPRAPPRRQVDLLDRAVVGAQREVVDDAVAVDRRPPEAIGRPRAADVGGRRVGAPSGRARAARRRRPRRRARRASARRRRAPRRRAPRRAGAPRASPGRRRRASRPRARRRCRGRAPASAPGSACRRSVGPQDDAGRASPGTCHATAAPTALGSVPLSVSRLSPAAVAGTPPSRIVSAAALSASAPAARIARRTLGRSAIAAATSIPRAVCCSGASTTTGPIRPAANARPTTRPAVMSPSTRQAAASA